MTFKDWIKDLLGSDIEVADIDADSRVELEKIYNTSN